jgi:hypothetical protein
MKQQQLSDLIAHLSSATDAPGWDDERVRLLALLQAERDARVPYQSSVFYRLQQHCALEGGGREWRSIAPETLNLRDMRARVRKAMGEYPMSELRLYHGVRRIVDVVAWLNEEEQ